VEDLIDRLNAQNLSLASIDKRIFAFFIDDIVVSFLVFLAFYNSFSSAKDMEEIISVTNSLFLYIVMIKVIYHTFFVWQYGATMGKILFKIVVVDANSFYKLSLFSSFIRAIVRVVSEGLFYLGFFWALINPTRQTWHDLASKSVVIDA